MSTAKANVKTVKGGKGGKVKLTKEEKSKDPRYVFNPLTDDYVKKTSPNGKIIVNTKEGEEPKLILSKNAFGVALVEALKKCGNFTDKEIKEAFAKDGIVLPRSFPKKWGGSGKAHSTNSNMPKRALTAYNFYSMEVRPKIKKENPGVDNKQIMSLIGEAWSSTSPAKRKKYIAKAEKDRERYNEECKAMNIAVSASDKPKKTSGFILYKAANRDKFVKENEGKTRKEVNTLINETWKDFTDDKKKVWNDKAAVQNEGYAERLAAWKKENGQESGSESGSESDSESDSKKEDTILNPKTGRRVKRSSAMGKKLVKQEEEKNATQEELPDDDKDLLENMRDSQSDSESESGDDSGSDSDSDDED